MNKRKLIIIISSVLSIIIFVTIIILIINFSNQNKNSKLNLDDKDIIVTEKEDEIYSRNYFDAKYKYQTTMLKTPNDGTKPDNYDSKTNIYYALYKLNHTKDFKCTTLGKTIAAGFMEQNTKNLRIVSDKEAFIQTVSDGALKVATQKYFKNCGEEIKERKTTKIKDLNPEFNNEEIQNIDTKTYLEEYGWLPFKPYGHIISDDTIIKASELKKENNNYIINLEMDPNNEKTPYFYQNEVKTTGSLEGYPKFSLINLEFTIDENWRILKVVFHEKMKVTKNFIFNIEVETENNQTDTFEYDNIKIDDEIINIFK